MSDISHCYVFKKLKLLYLYSQFNYCIYKNSLPLWWRLSWSWLLISHLDTLPDFRGVVGCDSLPVAVHTVQYFGRLWVTVTPVNMKPGFAICCNCVEYCGPCGNWSVACIAYGFCGRKATGFMCGSDWLSAGKYLSMQKWWTSPNNWANECVVWLWRVCGSAVGVFVKCHVKYRVRFDG
jgi:hypothetical protein